MKANENYALMMGDFAVKRLQLLNEIINPYTFHLLKQAGNLQGKRILDVGCGGGFLSCEFAKMVGKQGNVTAIDISIEQLAIAKQIAQQQHVDNIEFIKLAAEDLSTLKQQFDFIYCRYLLMHLPDPFSILKQMYQALKLGGFLMCEEMANIESIYADPMSPVIEQMLKYFRFHPKIAKTDVYIGRQLSHLLKQLPINIVAQELVQPILMTPQQKYYLVMLVTEYIPALVKNNCASEHEVQQHIEQLKLIAADEFSVITMPQHLQIIGVKN
jgi:ubiquinone/menaquinone biosynthesis C-methylase UbiE